VFDDLEARSTLTPSSPIALTLRPDWEDEFNEYAYTAASIDALERLVRRGVIASLAADLKVATWARVFAAAAAESFTFNAVHMISLRAVDDVFTIPLPFPASRVTLHFSCSLSATQCRALGAWFARARGLQHLRIHGTFPPVRAKRDALLALVQQLKANPSVQRVDVGGRDVERSSGPTLNPTFFKIRTVSIYTARVRAAPCAALR